MSAKDYYNQRYLDGYRNALSGYEIARWKALDHFIPGILSKNNKVRKLLDYGAGSGLFIPLWKKLFEHAEIFATDISSVALEKISEKFPEMKGCCALVKENRSEWESQMFDLVVSIEVMEHVEDLKAYLKDVFRLLKPGGYFIWTTPCANNFSIEHLYALITGQIDSTANGSRRWRWEDSGHLRRLKTREIKFELSEAGFTETFFRYRAHLFSFLCTYLPGKPDSSLRETIMMWDYNLFRVFPNGASMLGGAIKPE